MNGQGLGGVGFSGGIGQPGATGMGPGGMGGGGMGMLGNANDYLFALLASHPEMFGMPRGGGGVPQPLIQRAIAQIQGSLGAPQQAAAPPPAQMVRQAPQAAPTAPLTPVTPQSPYAGILNQQGTQAGYGGMLSRMMGSPNRQMLRRPGIT